MGVASVMGDWAVVYDILYFDRALDAPILLRALLDEGNTSTYLGCCRLLSTVTSERMDGSDTEQCAKLCYVGLNYQCKRT